VACHIPGAWNLQILFFGLTISSSWANGHATPCRALLRALHKLGIDVVFYEKDVPYYARHRDFDSCDYCELILYKDWEAIRQNALRQAGAADIVLTASYLPEGARISEELLGLEGPLHVFYDLDTPITLKRMQDAGVDYLRADLIPQFDLYLSFTGGRILRALEQNFGARCALPLYGCVDPDLYVHVDREQRFACDLSFMGTYAPDRADCIRELFMGAAERLPDQSFLLAGSMYPTEWVWPGGVKRVEHVAPSEHPALYSSSRATLNLTRREMARSGYCPSGRFFEASACGTPLLTDEWEGLESFFNLEQELLVVRSTDDVVRALQLPNADLLRMAVRARERTLDEHTGHQRARQLLAACEEARQTKTAIAETFS
jgi:spore maturation protein CgeB